MLACFENRGSVHDRYIRETFKQTDASAKGASRFRYKTIRNFEPIQIGRRRALHFHLDKARRSERAFRAGVAASGSGFGGFGNGRVGAPVEIEIKERVA